MLEILSFEIQHGDCRELMEALAPASVWAPEFPEDEPIGLRRVQILPRETFDSSATPKHGEKRSEPKALAPADLERLRSKMAATIERAKAEDPRELRRRIAELEKEVRAQGQALQTKTSKRAESANRIEVPILKAAQVKALEKTVDRLEKDGARLFQAIEQLDAQRDRLAQAQQVLVSEAGNLRAQIKAAVDGAAAKPSAGGGLSGYESFRSRPHPGEALSLSRPAPRPETQKRGNGHDGAPLPAGEDRVLRAIAQYPGGATREQITILAGYKRSTRDAYIQRLRERGYLEASGDMVVATAEGAEALGRDFEPLPTGEALRQHWMARLPEGERRVLGALIAAYPDAVDRDRLSEEAGYKRSTRDAYLQRLGARRLVVIVDRGAVRASEELFA